jgi:predicted ribosome quality control (RQC) complex YloA/Tae2 family protein
MHQQTIQEIVKELESVLVGRFMGKVFQLSPLSLAIDFGIREAGFLFISVDPALPGIYLIQRRGRELEQQSIPPLLFVQAMRSNLAGGRLLSITKDKSERVVRLIFSVANELGGSNNVALVAQLTGRSANLFLLNHEAHITHALRAPKGEGQQVGKQYEPPASKLQPNREEGLEGANSAIRALLESPLAKGTLASLSAAADDH